MSQVSVAPTTAPARSSWHALRPVLVLGGFVAVWWALMTGVAHADGVEDSSRHSVLDHANTSKATTAVRKTVEPVTRKVTRKVTSAVESTPVVREVTRSATTTVTETVSETVTRTRSVLEKSAAGPAVDPVLKPVDEVVKPTTQRPESSTEQGNSPSKRIPGPSTATSFAQQLPIAVETGGPGSATGTGSDRAQPSEDGGSPSAPDPCASPSGSGPSSSASVGITESSLFAVPSVVGDIHTWRLARLPGGPAYEPGSSPD